METVKFAIIGTRGIPANYGGFETFAEEVAARLAARGVAVLVIGDKGQQYDLPEYKGVKVLKTPTSKPANPLKFYWESLKIATDQGADFILMCGVGGSMAIPFIKEKEAIIAVNPDGLGFKRDKYPGWKKFAFYTQYWISAKVSKYLVCDSKGIAAYYKEHFGRSKNVSVIEYGTYINPFLQKGVTTEDFSDQELPYLPFQYHLIVARLEPENNVEMILKGFSREKRKFPLVVVGNTDTAHANQLLEHQWENIHFIGGVYNRKKLQLLRAGSLAYWHGHSVGGTNPSLLEAMGSANLCVCHDNIFNREVVREHGLYFADDKETDVIFSQLENGQVKREQLVSGTLNRAKTHYTWELITEKYLNLAMGALKNSAM